MNANRGDNIVLIYRAEAKGRSSALLGQRNANIVFEFLYDTLISDLVLCHYSWREEKKRSPN